MPPAPAYSWFCVLHTCGEILHHAAHIRAQQVSPHIAHALVKTAAPTANGRESTPTTPEPSAPQANSQGSTSRASTDVLSVSPMGLSLDIPASAPERGKDIPVRSPLVPDLSPGAKITSDFAQAALRQPVTEALPTTALLDDPQVLPSPHGGNKSLPSSASFRESSSQKPPVVHAKIDGPTKEADSQFEGESSPSASLYSQPVLPPDTLQVCLVEYNYGQYFLLMNR
jgi:hypothetical protein